MTKTALQAALDYYAKRGLAYQNYLGQDARFHAVLRMLEPVPWRTIHDVGCGYGDLVPKLMAANPFMERYRGCDVVPKSIQSARRKYQHPRVDFAEGGIEKCPTIFDAQVAIGVFALKAPDAPSNLQLTVQTMFERCNHAVVFTALTKKNPRDFEQSYSLDFLVSFAESLSEKVAIDRATLPYAACIGIYRT